MVVGGMTYVTSESLQSIAEMVHDLRVSPRTGDTAHQMIK